MFKHILIPTDGSALAEKAIAAGIALAKESGARITGYHVLEAVPARLYAFPYRGEEEAIAEFEERRQAAARKHIADIARKARKQGVAFEPVVQTARTPYEGIVKAAQEALGQVEQEGGEALLGADRAEQQHHAVVAHDLACEHRVQVALQRRHLV